jgi:hypothetical protein
MQGKLDKSTGPRMGRSLPFLATSQCCREKGSAAMSKHVSIYEFWESIHHVPINNYYNRHVVHQYCIPLMTLTRVHVRAPHITHRPQTLGSSMESYFLDNTASALYSKILSLQSCFALSLITLDYCSCPVSLHEYRWAHICQGSEERNVWGGNTARAVAAYCTI